MGGRGGGRIDEGLRRVVVRAVPWPNGYNLRVRQGPADSTRQRSMRKETKERLGSSPAAGSGRSDLLRDDSGLREAFRRGDRHAMERVFREYERLVRTIVRQGFGRFRGVCDPVEQDELVQTIFVAAFEPTCRSRYDGLQPYASFLSGIARNKIRQCLAKDARFRRTDIPWEDPCGPPPSDPERCVLREEARLAVARFRATLDSELEQRVLQGYFVDGRSEERLARDLGITRYRVRKVLASLHAKMRRFFKNHDVLVD